MQLCPSGLAPLAPAVPVVTGTAAGGVSPHGERETPSVADVLRRYWPKYLDMHRKTLTTHQIHVMTQLTTCRTAELGGAVWRCAECGHEHLFYCSCGNRQCPTCGEARRYQWLTQMIDESLPVPYVHIVTTTPHELSELALANRKLVYGLLFDSTRKALQRLTKDTQVLGAQIGGMMMLHTWGQKGLPHMHTHTLVPAGGPSFDRTRWIHAPDPGEFVPREALMQTFRELFLSGLEKLFLAGKLQLEGVLHKAGESPEAFRQWLQMLRDKDWVVNVQGPPQHCQDPDAAIKYLARYMQGSAISDGRILADDGAHVTFQAKDYRNGGESITLKVTGQEFVRRFVMHILPKRFSRIRYFGILSRRSKKADLALCRKLLEAEEESTKESTAADNETQTDSCSNDGNDEEAEVNSETQANSMSGDSDDQAEVEVVAKCRGCGKRGTLRWQSKIPGTVGWQRNCSLTPHATRRRLAATTSADVAARPP